LDLNSLLIPGLIIVFISLVAIYLAYLFNRLVRFRNAAEANLGQIRVALKKTSATRGGSSRASPRCGRRCSRRELGGSGISTARAAA